MCGVSLSLPVRALFAAHLHQGGYVRAAQAIATRLFDLYEIKRKRKSGGVRESVDVRGEGGVSEIRKDGGAVNETEGNNNTDNGNDENSISNDDDDKYNSVILLKPPDFLLTAWTSALKLRSASRLILQTVQAAQAVRYTEECNKKENQKIKEKEKAILTEGMILAELNENKSESEIKSENDPQNPPSVDGVNQKINEIEKLEIFSIEELGSILYNRILFLFEIESNSLEHPAEYMGDSSLLYEWIKSGSKESTYAQQTVHTDFINIMNTNLSFITDLKTSIPHIRTVLDGVQALAVSRTEGLKSLRNSLDQVTEDFGGGARCALLLPFPKAIR